MFKKQVLFMSLLSVLLACASNNSNQYNSILAFSEGLVPVSIGSSTGYVNNKGEVVIPYIFSSAYHFHKGTAVAESGDNYYLINKTGGRVHSTNYNMLFLNESHDSYFFSNDIGYGLLNSKGEEISSTYRDLYSIIESNRIAVSNGLSWGFLNEKGVVTIQLSYQDVLPFSEDLAGVKSNGLWGFINPDGSFAITPLFDEVIYSFNTHGYAVVQTGSSQALIDRNGNVIKRGYEISLIGDLYRYQATSTAGYQILKSNGDFLTLTSYYRVYRVYGTRGANVQKTSSRSTDSNIVFDETGNIIFDRPYNESKFISDFVTAELYFVDGASSTKLITSLKDNKQRVITAEVVNYISNKWIIVSDSNDLYGAYNPSNVLTVSLLYGELFPTNDGFFIAASNNYNVGIIDQSGKTIVPLIYDSINPFKNPYFWN